MFSPVWVEWPSQGIELNGTAWVYPASEIVIVMNSDIAAWWPGGRTGVHEHASRMRSSESRVEGSVLMSWRNPSAAKVQSSHRSVHEVHCLDSSRLQSDEEYWQREKVSPDRLREIGPGQVSRHGSRQVLWCDVGWSEVSWSDLLLLRSRISLQSCGLVSTVHYAQPTFRSSNL